MKAFKFILVLAVTTFSLVTNAAFICKPNTDCGREPTPIPPTPRENKYLITTDVQIKSPECRGEDLQMAIAEAKAKNLERAEGYLGTTNIALISEPMVRRSCSTSIYSRSNELYWIVQIFAYYKYTNVP